MTGITVEIFRSREQVHGIRAEWTDLASGTDTGHCFDFPDFLLKWFELYGKNGSLYVMAVREGDRLIGIAPLYKKKAVIPPGLTVTGIRRLGEGGACRTPGGIIALKTRHPDVVRAVGESLLQSREWDEVYLKGMSACSTDSAVWKSLGGRTAVMSVETHSHRDICLKLPPARPEFLKRPDRVHKSLTFKKYRSLVRAGEIKVVRVADGMIHARLAKLMERYTDAGDSEPEILQSLGNGLPPRYYIELFFLEAGGRDAAWWVGLGRGQDYHVFISHTPGAGPELVENDVLQAACLDSILGRYRHVFLLNKALRFDPGWGHMEWRSLDIRIRRDWKTRFSAKYEKLAGWLRRRQKRLQKATSHGKWRNLPGKILMRIMARVYLSSVDHLVVFNRQEICSVANKNSCDNTIYREIEFDDLQFLRAYFGSERVKKFEDRLLDSRGTLIYRDGRPAGCSWFTDQIRPREGGHPFFYPVRPAPDTFYLYDLYILPEHRGYHLAEIITNCRMKKIMSLGGEKAFFIFFNPSMKKISLQLGGRITGVLRFRKFLWYTWQDIEDLGQVAVVSEEGNRRP